MTGASSVTVARRPKKYGVRRPRHAGLLAETKAQFLNPWMAAPVRPGEVIVGASLQGEAHFRRAVQLASAPLTYVEVGMWLVPLSTLGEGFLDLIVASPEDTLDIVGEERETGTIASGATGGTLADVLQLANRPWAGEIGSATTPVDTDTLYMPYVSRATWDVGSAWYDLEMGDSIDSTRLTAALYDEPPRVGNFIRSSTGSGVNAAQALDSENTGLNSISELIENLSLLTKTDRTYAEYLAGFGIPPHKIASMPRPIMTEQRLLRAHRPAFPSGVSSENATVTNNPDATLDSKQINVSGTHDLVMDSSGMGMLSTVINRHRRAPVMTYEPSILLGTCVWYALGSNESQYTHHFDMSLMTSGAHWGDVAFGGVDEVDFLKVGTLATRDGGAGQSGEDGQGSILAMNMLNLYMFGDRFSNDADEFAYRTIGGPEHLATNQVVNWKLSAQLHILSDLVGG